MGSGWVYWCFFLTHFHSKQFWVTSVFKISVIVHGCAEFNLINLLVAMDPIDLIAKGKIQRYFRATKKLNAPGLVSHITQRAAGKEPLFIEDGDYLAMLGLFKEVAEKYRINSYAFCLMPNHIHLLLSPSKSNLYDAMRDLFSRYATYFNKKYMRKGHLFGGPYRQAVCLDDAYLLAASLYIHLNPARAGIVDAPVKYRWSSIRLYVDKNAPRSFINPEFVLEMLGYKNRDKKTAYDMLLRRGLEINPGHVLEQENSIEQFCAKLSKLFPRLFQWVEKRKKVAGASGVDVLAMDTLNQKIKDLKNLPQKQEAKKYVVEQLIARGFKRKEISERLGVSRKTVYNILNSDK